MTMSHDWLHRIKGLSAFSIPCATHYRLNQHSTDYRFQDGSRLKVNATNSEGVAYDAENHKIASHKFRINK